MTAPLSLIITAFAPVTDAMRTLTPQINLEQDESDLILIDLGAGRNRLGGSALAQVYGQVGDDCPDVDDPEDLRAFFAVIQGLNADGQLLAYHDRRWRPDYHPAGDGVRFSRGPRDQARLAGR